MISEKILDMLYSKGFNVTLIGEVLTITPSCLPDELKTIIKANKGEIIKTLTKKSTQESIPSSGKIETLPPVEIKKENSEKKSEALPDLLTLNKTISDLSSRLIQLSAGVRSGTDRYRKIDQAFTYLQNVENFEDPQNTIPVILEAIDNARVMIAELSKP